MEAPGIIYQAIDQIRELYDLPIKVFSYNSYFDRLWGFHIKKNLQPEKANEIWCVVDEGTSEFRWLKLCLWGGYFRATHPNPPRLILLGREKDLDMTDNELAFPKDYIDSGIKILHLTSKSFIVDFLNAMTYFTENETSVPQEDKINKWQRKIRTELTSDEHRHHISNEIAPILLREAISKSSKKIGADYKPFVEKAKKDIQLDTISYKEGKALLKLWQWITRTIDASSEEGAFSVPKIEDIWDLWQKKARFILIDDQAKDHKYENIIRCALELVINHEVLLTDFKKFEEGMPTLCSVTSIKEKSEIDTLVTEIQRNYECLFLDLRLNEADRSRTNYEELTGVVVAKALSKVDPSFPIILFTSSQKREVDDILKEHKNIIQFRKPGIAGSAKAINGTEALKKLLDAIVQAVEMIENRIIYKSIAELGGKYKGKKVSLECRIKDKKTDDFKNTSIVMNIDDIFLQELYDSFLTIFLDKQYQEGLSRPDLIMHYIFKAARIEKWWNSADRFPVISNSPRFDIKPTRGGHVVKLKSGTSQYVLSDFSIVQYSTGLTFNINLHYFVFCRLRDMVAHMKGDWHDYRREVIILYRLFIDTLSDSWDANAYLDPAQLSSLNALSMNLIKSPLGSDYYDMIGMPFEAISDIKRYVADLFSAVCYYGNNQKYDMILKYCQHYYSSSMP